MRKIRTQKQKGFTLIELLVIIAIIGTLAAVVLVALAAAQSDSKTTKVEADLAGIRTAMELLVADTGKWPNGCPPDTSANPEVDLDDPAAGLVAQPTAGVIDAPCEWTSAEVASWNGPYVSATSAIDPWGNPYLFDADYQPLTATAIVLLSYGPDGLNYTSDDIYLLIQE